MGFVTPIPPSLDRQEVDAPVHLEQVFQLELERTFAAECLSMVARNPHAMEGTVQVTKVHLLDRLCVRAAYAA